MKGLIPYASTELQAKVIEMRAEGKTWEAITELTGMDASNGRKIIAKVKRRAANAGYSPQHDMTHTVPDGFGVKGVSTMYDREGNVAAQWVKSQATQRSPEELAEFLKDSAGEYRGRVYGVPHAAISTDLGGYGGGGMSGIPERVKRCVTHHYACDCREYAHEQAVAAREDEIEILEARIEALEAKNVSLPDRWIDDVVTDVDGYKYYCPLASGGYFAAHHLRAIATGLDELNKDWDEQIRRDLDALEESNDNG